jgi:hypothetical protein
MFCHTVGEKFFRYTTGKPCYAVCLRRTAKWWKHTAELLPCVSSRRTPHGDAGHGECSMPWANNKTHGDVFAVCSQPTHGEVKQQTAGGWQTETSYGPSSSLPCEISMPWALSSFAVSRSLPCAIYLQMNHAQCAVGNNFAVILESLPWACFRRCPVGQQSCIMPCGCLCRVSRHSKDSIQIARSPSQHHSLPTRVSFAVRKHTAEDIWFLCRVQVSVFSLFWLYLQESLHIKYNNNIYASKPTAVASQEHICIIQQINTQYITNLA